MAHPDLIHSKENKLATGFPAVHYKITGVKHCCSAALLCSVGGSPRAINYDAKSTGAYFKEARTFKEYYKHWAMQPQFWLPQEFAFCKVLEGVYEKHTTGEGGEDMWASPSYATKTWFMVDRRRTKGAVCVLNFMHWLKELGTGEVGRIHISPWRPGAHGGECKGAVFSPDDSKVRAYLNNMLAKANAHARAMAEYMELPQNVEEIEPVDEVGGLW